MKAYNIAKGTKLKLGEMKKPNVSKNYRSRKYGLIMEKYKNDPNKLEKKLQNMVKKLYKSILDHHANTKKYKAQEDAHFIKDLDEDIKNKENTDV